MKRKTLLKAATILSLVALSACASQPAPPETGDVAGFFSGLWHGLTIVFSFVGSWFTDVRIYQYPNSGVGYDAGFVIGAILLGGAVAAS